MSMDDAPLEGAVEAGPAEVGDTGSETIETQGTEEPEQPSRQYVEVDDPDNRYVRVKVAGEDVEVPFSEAVKGYSREADYTRKAQEVAQQRQEAEYALNLQRALQANPEMTLRILSDQYGLQLGNAPPPPVEEPEFADPLERQLHEERQARIALEQRFAQRETDEQLRSAVGDLRQQFGLDDDDVRAVVGTAYQLGVGVDAFPQIYKAMAYDRIAARVQASQAEQARVAAETARRQAAAAQAGQAVGTGMSSNGITNRPAAEGPMTIRQAIEAALLQHEA